MAHQVRMLVAKVDDLSSNPGIHMVQGENRLLHNFPQIFILASWHNNVCTHIHRNNVLKKKPKTKSQTPNTTKLSAISLEYVLRYFLDAWNLRYSETYISIFAKLIHPYS